MLLQEESKKTEKKVILELFWKFLFDSRKFDYFSEQDIHNFFTPHYPISEVQNYSLMQKNCKNHFRRIA
jgi:hypothetical protein